MCCSTTDFGSWGTISSKCRCSSNSNPAERKTCVSCRTCTASKRTGPDYILNWLQFRPALRPCRTDAMKSGFRIYA